MTSLSISQSRDRSITMGATLLFSLPFIADIAPCSGNQRVFQKAFYSEEGEEGQGCQRGARFHEHRNPSTNGDHACCRAYANHCSCYGGAYVHCRCPDRWWRSEASRSGCDGG